MKTLMRNGRDRRSENPFLGHARKERVSLFGTDQRITSGPAATRLHSKAEYMTAPERFADSQIPLAPRAPSIHDPKPNIRGAAIRSPTAMTSSTAVVTFQTRHAEPGHGFSGSFFVQRATAPFQIVGIISLRIAESWRPHSRSMFRTEGCYPSSGRPRIQCGRPCFCSPQIDATVRLLSLVRQACDAPRFAPQECATQLG